MTFITDYLKEINHVVDQLPHDTINAIITALAQARDNGRHIFVMGNGGSGATASHAVNDFTKLAYQQGKPRLKVIALTDNMPLILAVANDWDYSRIFVEQLMALAEPDDLLIGISGSGNSPSVITAMDWANANGLTTIGLTGRDGGQLKDKTNLCLIVATDSMTHIEDAHMMLCHIFATGLQTA